MALPYLSAEHNQAVLDYLATKATTPMLIELVMYIRPNWIKGDLWSPDKWSVFGQAVRTNNYVEGWHGMLNRHAKRGNLSFYLMVHLLYEQAQIVNMQVHLVTDQKLKRRQQSNTDKRKDSYLLHGHHKLLVKFRQSGFCADVLTLCVQTQTELLYVHSL